MKQADWKRLEIGGADLAAYPDEQREKPEDSSQRTDAQSRGRQWQDWRRGCL